MEMMEHMDIFYNSILENPRISTTHISLYMSLLLQWYKQGCKDPFAFRRADIMREAKINSRHTYNKCMNELQSNGLVRYRPASNRATRSNILFVI